jgi:hypothetical protein
MLIEALKKYHDAKFTPGVYEHSVVGKAALMLEKSVEIPDCKKCAFNYTIAWHQCERCLGEATNNFVERMENEDVK